MDTLAFRQIQSSNYFKTFESLITVSICLTLIIGNYISPSPIFANDLVANNIVNTPALVQSTRNAFELSNPQKLEENFETRILNKYSGYKVNSIDRGIKHIKMVKYFSGRPVKINVVEINRQVAQNYDVKPATASSFSLQQKNTLRTIAGRTNSIVAINGGFFKPQTGVPLGTLMIDKKLYTGPIYDRVALGIFDDGYDIARVQFNGQITGNNVTLKIDNINQPRMLSSYIIAYTRDWGRYAPASPRYGTQLQIVGNKITASSANPLFIPENGYVLVGPKEQLSKLFGAETVKTNINIYPNWQNVNHIISGGPYLVRSGEIFVDTSAEKLQAISGKNPRTAVGYTKDNDLILVAVDGREGSSVGLTLYELAYFMKSLGCINAINLDGGGSTVMFVNGQIVNNPRQIGGIALSNALVISKKIR